MRAIHSLPACPRPAPLKTVMRASGPDLRPYVLGWAGFRAEAGTEQPTRMLPLNAATLIVDFTGMRATLTGPRSAVTLSPRPLWRHGVALGLTPAGMAALLGTPMREVTGAIAPLEDLLGAARAGELAGRLAEQASWAGRFGALERWLADGLRARAASRGAPGADGLVLHAWWRLQAPAGPHTIGALAGELGVSRRYLELGFRRVVGLTPKTVARVARFQRAVHALTRPSATLGGAVACGYADQPHLAREVRAMAELTPKELFALIQDTGRLTR
ncbi:helix-turn-helix transcriptional regulator [Nonomuraea sp. PA05]|uniref:helix-turn-helix transcriptional regulator n=1 Tax=Nonomuraea sp. PA05 TaxID=2604466 RepID=UPI0011D4ECA2|nr:helix-turn-helix transcriptional regulator [Nonomuraea sp. PA05]TYB53016.1 helix-turn-helix transcriptional regulator [Nonomuraea sp. PA05]